MSTGGAARAVGHPRAAGSDAGDGWGYRPHLDGLRAVAVYLVVAFHAGADRVAGGFIGVDVFFVLSGYLVTGVLLRAADDRGRVGLVSFYSRRARRLLPASLVNLLVTAVVFAAIAAPAELPSASEAIRAAALYVSNWWFIAEDAAYFGTDVTASPVLHYWSLSVEEQFYLLWPLLLSGLFMAARRVGRVRSRRVVQVAVAGGAVASLTWAFVLAGEDPTRSYYGTDARAYQLLAGALLALAPGLLARIGTGRRAGTLLPVLVVAGLGGLLLLATDLIDLTPVQRGAATTLVSLAVLVGLESGRGGIGRWVLSRPTLVWLGRLSYGTYLWHWLIVIVLSREVDISPMATFLVTAAVATGLAAVSFQVLETPIRRTPRLDRRPGPVVATALAMSLLVGLVVVPSVVEPDGAPGTGTAAAAAGAPTTSGTPVTVDWQSAMDDLYDDQRCGEGGDVVCPLHEGEGRRALLVGDSHAGMITPMVVDLAERHDLDLDAVYLPYCPWVRGVRYEVFGNECWDDQEVLYEETIPELDPELVILIHRSVDDPLTTTGVIERSTGRVDGTSEEAARVLETGMQTVLDDLRGDGRDVVMIEPIPSASMDPLICLSEATVLEECRFVATRSPLPQEQAMRRLAEAEGALSVDLDRAVCPYLPICDPVVDGEVVFHDAGHITTEFGRLLLEPLDQVLVEAGVVGGG